jgi:hypothetical protein
VPVGSVWLLTLMASSVLRNRRDRWLVAACWGFCFFLPGVVPIVTNLPAPAAFSLSIACTVILLVLNGRVASRGVLAWELPAVLRTGGARAVPNCHGGHR